MCHKSQQYLIGVKQQSLTHSLKFSGHDMLKDWKATWCKSLWYCLWSDAIEARGEHANYTTDDVITSADDGYFRNVL
jgi:hypothetical protein